MKLDGPTILLTSALALVYAALRLAGPVGLPGTQFSASIAFGFAFVVGLCFDIRGAPGVGLGHVAGATILGVDGPARFAGTVTAVTISLTAPYLWGNVGRLSSGRDPYSPSVGWFAEVVTVGALVSLCATVTSTAITAVTLGLPTYVVAPRLFVALAVAILAIGVPVLLLMGVAEDLGRPSFSSNLSEFGSERTTSLLVVSSTIWLAVASLMDLGFTFARTVTPRVYRSWLGVDATVNALNGAQVAGHVLLGGITVYLYMRWRQTSLESAT